MSFVTGFFKLSIWVLDVGICLTILGVSYNARCYRLWLMTMWKQKVLPELEVSGRTPLS